MDLSGVRLTLPGLGTETKQLVGVIPPAVLSGLSRDGVVDRPVSAELAVWREEKRYRVTGWVRGHIRLTCSRCMEEFGLELAGEVDREFRVGTDPANREREIEMLEDVVFLEDGVLSPRDLVEEELVLLLPMVPLCRENCRGLCPECGADLNREPCRCADDPANGPFSVLQALKRSGRDD